MPRRHAVVPPPAETRMDAPMQPFTLCADDYALSPAVDAGILQLLRQQRLGAVSCLAGAPGWPAAAPALAAFAGRVDIGLHLNFTEAFPGQPAHALPAFIALAGLRLLRVRDLEREIDRQLGCFREVMGRLPDYLDGHQHVHQLPQVREALLRQVARQWRDAARPWVRLSRPRRWRGLKAAVIGALGGGALRWRLRERGLLCNPDFAGVYSLSPAVDYRRLMQAWLATLAPGGLIMCHPALAAAEGPAPPDALARARVRELDYLCSFDFEADCRTAGRLPVRFGGARGRGGP